MMLNLMATFIAALALSALGPAMASSTKADPDDMAQVARGEALYAKSCASCHGVRLEGQDDWRTTKPDGAYPAPPHDEDGHTWHHSDKLLFRYTKLGGAEALASVPGFKSAMPAFRDVLSDQDIWDILAYIKSHWSDRAQEYQQAVTANDS